MSTTAKRVIKKDDAAPKPAASKQPAAIKPKTSVTSAVLPKPAQPKVVPATPSASEAVTPKFGSSQNHTKSKSRIEGILAKEAAQNTIAPLQLLPTIPVPTLPTLSSAKKPTLSSSGTIFNTTAIDPKLLPQLSTSNNAIRGYSELKKSEAALQLELTKKETERDSAVRQAAELERRLKSEVSIRDAKIMALESQLDIDNQQWREKLSFLETSAKEQLSNAITLHASRYDELSSEHSTLKTRSKDLEDQLERCGVDPISLTPFDTSIGLKEREQRQQEIKDKKAVLSEQIRARKEELKRQIESMKQIREQLESIHIEDIPVVDVDSFTMDFTDKSSSQDTLNKENVVNNVQVVV